ncbi:sigma-70 family RNA polymerase sigma factor [Aestuariibaculum sp. M13]|uniref:RNA polymerase sigma factor n=1 Tax=Aestuariibaculum sp. M13 TaxID=2967132 RepID=UPI00215A06A5|nr:sigma-70 family RNA polymerase sigma factor [Aestuariibaculum sp. M13]MCR8668732.1 sigma-70 family RNA polymerase sigma factor [Aestuariibaculum sp. M13]
MDENKLIAQIKTGNKLAFKQLFDNYYETLCLYLVNFTNNKQAAENLIQIVFINFWNKRSSIEINSSVKNYLRKMAYREFLMDLRKNKKEASILETLKYDALIEANVPTEEELANKNERLLFIISQLPDRCQEVLILKMDGMKYKDIAEKLEISTKTVESQIRIAFNKIRKEFKNELFLFLTILE